jgi:hypothetical protein
MKTTLTVAGISMKSVWQAVCRPARDRLCRLFASGDLRCAPVPLRSGSLRSAITTLLLAPLATLHAADSPKPNIVILYADDLGYGDVQCYNPERGKIPTPHIDKLAAQGMRSPAHRAGSRHDWKPGKTTGLPHRLHRQVAPRLGLAHP